jgi:hypothetical protein
MIGVVLYATNQLMCVFVIVIDLSDILGILTMTILFL